MFVAESVYPQFGQAFSLGLYTLARPSSGLMFPLPPPSASFAIQALTCLATFAFDIFLPKFQHRLLFADSVVHFCILAWEAFIALAASEFEELVQLSVHPRSADAQASPPLADLFTYVPLECLDVLHLFVPRHNPLFLLHQITSAPISQPKVFCAFLNHVSPSISVLPHCSRFRPPHSCLSQDSAPVKLGFPFYSWSFLFSF